MTVRSLRCDMCGKKSGALPVTECRYVVLDCPCGARTTFQYALVPVHVYLKAGVYRKHPSDVPIHVMGFKTEEPTP